MQAIRGVYKSGVVELEEKAPMDNAEVIVTFIKEASIPGKDKMSSEEALRILKKYSGSIDRDIDIEKERDEYLNEKHGSFNRH